jgi:hypothetical protein
VIATKVLTAVSYASLGFLSLPLWGTFPLAAQQQDQAPHAWRRAADVPPDQLKPDQSPPEQSAVEPEGFPQQATPSVAQNPAPPGPPPPPRFDANRGYQGPAASPQSYPAQQPYPAQQQYPAPANNYSIPAHLTIKPGTYVMVRINQGLSSDRNQPGDTFFGTLAEPIIVDGIVVAQRGQTVSGRVIQAQKAGRVEGTSRLGVELTGLTVVDGQQLSMQSQMIDRRGPTSEGRDAGAIAGTTALGAAIGAGADWGRGAAIGAGAGAAAGIIGVLLTRGHPTVIYPESILTFRTTSAVAVDTQRASQAFRYAESQDYGRAGSYSAGPPPSTRVAVAPPPPYYYGPAYYPYYWGPGFSFYYGRPFYYGRGYYRGFRR